MIHSALLMANFMMLSFLLLFNYMRSMALSISIYKCLLRPSQLVLLYMHVFFILGSIFFMSENVLDNRLLVEADRWRSEPVILFIIISFAAIGLSNLIRLGPPERSFSKEKCKARWPWEVPAFLLAGLSTASESAILLSFSTAFYFAGAANGRARSPFFIIWLLGGVLLVLPVAAYGKRLLLFPLMIVLAILWRDGVIKSRVFIGLFALSASLILPFSIMRGYGGFGVENFEEAIRYVSIYLASDNFLPALGNNIEAVSFYFHGMNALQMAFNSGEYLWGETLLNMFFLGSSIYGFEDGLRSSIDVYTFNFDPGFRAIGGSYPVMTLSEFFMNFGIFSLILFPIFLIFLDSVWRRIQCVSDSTVRFSSEASLLTATLLLARGSSFDLFLFNVIVLLFPIVTFVLLFNKLKFRRSNVA